MWVRAVCLFTEPREGSVRYAALSLFLPKSKRVFLGYRLAAVGRPVVLPPSERGCGIGSTLSLSRIYRVFLLQHAVYIILTRRERERESGVIVFYTMSFVFAARARLLFSLSAPTRCELRFY